MLLELMICSTCGGKLEEHSSNKWECSKCGNLYRDTNNTETSIPEKCVFNTFNIEKFNNWAGCGDLPKIESVYIGNNPPYSTTLSYKEYEEEHIRSGFDNGGSWDKIYDVINCLLMKSSTVICYIVWIIVLFLCTLGITYKLT